MKKYTKQITLFMLLVLCIQSFAFSAEKKSALALGKEVVELQYELYKIDHRLEEYEDMSDFKLNLIRKQKELLLKKKKKDFEKVTDKNTESMKNILDEALKDLGKKTKPLKDKGLDFLDSLKARFTDND